MQKEDMIGYFCTRLNVSAGSVMEVHLCVRGNQCRPGTQQVDLRQVGTVLQLSNKLAKL
jgi:hypothetical protein